MDDGGFVKFVIVDDVIEDIPGPLTKLLRLFNTRVGNKLCVTIIVYKIRKVPLNSHEELYILY